MPIKRARQLTCDLLSLDVRRDSALVCRIQASLGFHVHSPTMVCGQPCVSKFVAIDLCKPERAAGLKARIATMGNQLSSLRLSGFLLSSLLHWASFNVLGWRASPTMTRDGKQSAGGPREICQTMCSAKPIKDIRHSHQAIEGRGTHMHVSN